MQSAISNAQTDEPKMPFVRFCPTASRPSFVPLLDYSIRSRQHIRQNCEADLLGCFHPGDSTGVTEHRFDD
jgi:hypothetical protein